MKLATFLIFFLILVPLQVYATDLRFVWDFSNPSYTIYKGNSQNIGFTITNQEDAQIKCTISPSGLNQQQVIINSKGQSNGYFVYTSETKIKNLQNPKSLQVVISCNGNIQSSIIGCGTLFLSPCYENRQWILSKSVQIYFALTEQDQNNKNILEDYRKNIADKITDIDKKNQKLNELVLKTPNPILPNNAKNENSQNYNQINQLSGTFQNAVKSLEDENYDFGSRISLSSDSNLISVTNNKIDELTTSINSNLERYNKLTQNLNELQKEVKDKSSKFNYKFNTDLISKLNEIGTTIYSKISNYQFSDLDDAANLIKMYSKEKDDLLIKMENNVNDFSNKGIPSIIKQVELICNNFQLCDTKNKLKSLNLESTKNFDDLCKSFDGLSSEITKFNDKEAVRYQNELREPNKKNQEIKDKNREIQKDIEITQKRNDAKENLNLKLSTIEKEMTTSVKKLNSYGKTTDITKYSNSVKDFNNLNLDQKLNKTKYLEEASNEIKLKIDGLVSEEKGFVSFFKKAFYSIFGAKQEIEKLKLEEKEELPKLLAEIQNTISPARVALIDDESTKFLKEICTISDKVISDLKASSLDIRISDKESTIKTEAKEAEKSCFDENNQRTTKCCDGDEYKSRKDLYPVIFVHGHSFETARGDIQNSLSTFNYMSKYFSQNGYVEESLIYPESSEQLAKGVWAFCDKPVVIRLTYYDGLVSGTTHNYKNSISEYSPTLKKEIENVLLATNKDKAILVAHSMGGVLSRYYLKFDGGSDKIYKLITVGSPHYGIRAWASFWSPFGSIESQQMRPDSEFLKTLNYPVDSLVPSYTISGNNKGCFTKDCDGVVYVNSSKLKMATKAVVFDGNQYEHSSMLQQPEVSRQVLEYIKT